MNGKPVCHKPACCLSFVKLKERTVCPGSHFRETINNSLKIRRTDLAEGSLDAQLHARLIVRNFFSFEAILGDWDPISILLNHKQLHTRVISSLWAILIIIKC